MQKIRESKRLIVNDCAYMLNHYSMQFGSSENDKSANFQRATCFSACDFCLGGYYIGQ